jgi:hypothetical protein
MHVRCAEHDYEHGMGWDGTRRTLCVCDTKFGRRAELYVGRGATIACSRQPLFVDNASRLALVPHAWRRVASWIRCMDGQRKRPR